MKKKPGKSKANFFFAKQSRSWQVLLCIVLLSVICHYSYGQNSSYNLNSIPISGGASNSGFDGNTLFSNTTGQFNAANGFRALFSNTSGSNNTANGFASLFNNKTGSNNVGNGSWALSTNTNGSDNTALGYYADVSSGSLNNATAIGSGAIVNSSDAIQLGNSSVTQIFGGTGTNATFITGGLQVTGGTLSSGYVLTSDALGVATWQPAGGAGNWTLLGNAGTVDGTNFIGTTDNVPFNVRVNNFNAGRIDHIKANTSWGYQSAFSVSTGGLNTAIGRYASYWNTTGTYNTALGESALTTNATGDYNTAVGANANVISAGLSNATAIGYGAVATGNNLVQLGNSSVTQVFAGTGTNATLITGGLQVTGGTLAAGKVLTSDALGVATWQAAPATGWTQTGNAGTVDGTNFIGTTDNIPFSMRVNNSKAGRIDHLLGNAFFGYQAANATTGSNNTAIGTGALITNVSGNGNTALGYNADISSSGLSNATAIGNGAIATANNAIQLGNSSVTQVFAGTGTNATVITGGLQVTGGTLGVGRVLTSDAVGVASWQSIGSIASTGWSLSGNLGTVDGTDFLGTVDNVPFNVRVNNQPSGRIDPANWNVFFGYLAGNTATYTGFQNTAIGHEALKDGSGINVGNTAVGYRALYNNTERNNVAVGSYALFNNTGEANIGIGSNVLVNGGGGANIAIGQNAMQSLGLGYHNIAIGYDAMSYCNGNAQQDIAIGIYSSVTGTGTLTNATTIGHFSTVNTSLKIRLGAPTVTCVEGPVAYTVSDGRFKTRIEELDVKGLEFIKRLRPVVYNFDTKKFDEFLTKNMPDSIRKKHLEQDFAPSTAIRQSGFIAQEVEKAAKEVGYDFNGVHAPNDENDNYSLGYSQFVVPLVKGMQEQQAMIEELQKQLNEQKQITADFQKKTASSTGLEQLNVDLLGFSMSQNIPNPFTHETVVKFVLPQQIANALMVVYDLTGKQLTSFPINDRGASSLTITSEKLSAGIFIYTIIGDGKVLDSKRMIVADK